MDTETTARAGASWSWPCACWPRCICRAFLS